MREPRAGRRTRRLLVAVLAAGQGLLLATAPSQGTKTHPLKGVAAITRLRACLKRVAVGLAVRYTGAYEQPQLSHGRDRPPVGVYQRSGACCQAGRSAPRTGHAAGGQRYLVSRRHRLPMAGATARLSQVAKRLHLLSHLARRWHLAAHP